MRIGFAAVILLLAAAPSPGQTGPAESLEPGNYRRTLAWGGRTRSFMVHVPPAYNCRSSLPAVLLLHGGGGDAQQAMAGYQMNPVADRNGFLVVYPNGTGVLPERVLTWNAGHCCSYALENRIEDVGFIRALLDELGRLYKVDPDRLYATGISNGAMMSYRLAAELSDRFAGVAIVAGAIGGISEFGQPYIIPQPSRPVPMMIFHGRQDQRVLYEGGAAPLSLTPGRWDLSVAQAVSFWVRANGCSAQKSTVVTAGGNIVREAYGQCHEGADVVLYTVKDGTHSWPGAPRPLLLADLPNQDISANELMWEFFKNHARRPASPVEPPSSGPVVTLDGIGNAASYASGSLSPGEILAVFGLRLAGARVWIAESPAPVLYASDSQLLAVTPFGVAGKRCAQVQVETGAGRSTALTLPVAQSGPGIFAMDGSGLGQGAILNGDGSLNSQANPADKGAVVVLYATGGGPFIPVPRDGQVVDRPLPRLTLPVEVRIDGEEAAVLYAGPAPGLIAGALQVNVRIPAAARSGNLAVQVWAGEMASRHAVTVVVR